MNNFNNNQNYFVNMYYSIPWNLYELNLQDYIENKDIKT
jgi:hypothetical protein